MLVDTPESYIMTPIYLLHTSLKIGHSRDSVASCEWPSHGSIPESVIGPILLQVQTSAAPCWAQLQAHCAKDLQNGISYQGETHTHASHMI